MHDLRRELAQIIDHSAPDEGLQNTPVPGVQCIKVSRLRPRMKCYWRASVAVIAQGCKEIGLDGDIYRSDEAHYIATPIALPVTSRTFPASPTKPFLGVWVGLNPLIVNEVAAHLGGKLPRERVDPQRAVFVGKASDKLLESAIRLGELFRTPEDAPILGALIIKELIYHLLKGEYGPAILQFTRAGSKMHQIAQAIYRIGAELREEIDVVELADTASMSRSVFFKCFKEVTGISPIQYQKRLRLLEARRLMIDGGETAQSSAVRVGYRSASQFSREYSRMFGDAPLRDALKTKQTVTT